MELSIVNLIGSDNCFFHKGPRTITSNNHLLNESCHI